MSEETAAATTSLVDRMSAVLGGSSEPTPAAEPVQAEPAADTSDDDAIPEVTASEEAGQETDQSAEGTEAQTDNLAEVELDGELLKVPAKVKDAVMRHTDYTKKTMELADQRRLFQQQQQMASIQEAFQQEASEEIRSLAALEAQLEQYKKLPWAEMDTDQIVRARQAMDGLKDQRDELKTTLDAKRAQTGEKLSKARYDLLQQGAEFLKKTIPSWGDVAQRESAQAALNVGFSKDEVSNFMDPRAVHLAWKASQWDKLQASKPQVTQKVKTAPPTSKPGSAATTESTATQTYQKARQQLKKSGDWKDAARLLMLK
jgi:hypothetical protein